MIKHFPNSFLLISNLINLKSPPVELVGELFSIGCPIPYEFFFSPSSIINQLSFHLIDRSINCSDSLGICSCDVVFKYRLVRRIMSGNCLVNSRLGSGFNRNKFVCSRCCHRSCFCTDISSIVCFLQPTIKCSTDVNRFVIMRFSSRSIYITTSCR